jgi:hypothetical protein
MDRGDEEHDGRSPLHLLLSDGCWLFYLPTFGLPEGILEELEHALAASEAMSAEHPPPEDICAQSGSNRRQWYVEVGDRPMGWAGPRRWRRASWRLHGESQHRPVLTVQLRACAISRGMGAHVLA